MKGEEGARREEEMQGEEGGRDGGRGGMEREREGVIKGKTRRSRR